MSTREQDALRRAGEASVLILVSLADGPKHGYALQQDIEAFAGVRLGPGTLYGAISRLEQRGLIEAAVWKSRRACARSPSADAASPAPNHGYHAPGSREITCSNRCRAVA